MSKHTPAPWRVDGWENCTIYALDDSDGDPQFITCMKVRDRVIQEPQGLHSHPKLTEQKANALLIAAAPELLEALEYLIDDLRLKNMPTKSVEKCLKVIAKAKGEE